MKVSYLNKISPIGLNTFSNKYDVTDDTQNADLLLVRSFNMHEYPINDNLLAVARAGAGVNNIPLDKMAKSGVIVFNTPGANSNGVKELVIAGMLMSARDLLGGINWVKNNKEDKDILKSIEKSCVNFWITEGGWKNKKKAKTEKPVCTLQRLILEGDSRYNSVGKKRPTGKKLFLLLG